MSHDPATRYAGVRARTVALAAPLSPEDAQLQSMPDASPAKWHLAHTTWFFARFVLRDPAAIPDGWDVLFNSYYVGAGARHPRAARGLLSRPGLPAVLAWRDDVDERIQRGLADGRFDDALLQVLELGIHHEQQHQELLLTDIKHALWCNPLAPAYRAELPEPAPATAAGDDHARGSTWLHRDEAIVAIGAPRWPAPGADFAYDNESPRHRVLLPAHDIARHPVTNADYAGFIADGGYRRPTLWLSDGWDAVQREGWSRPLYWHEDGEREYTLGGLRPRDPRAPVCHLSHYEADAFARWAGARLPTEAEWEAAAAGLPVEGNFADAGAPLHPRADASAAGPVDAPRQMFGDAWEWTSSAYAPWPGFRPLDGTLGEYNGKFMSGQLVLRGGSCLGPRGHLRASYRNFFPPQARWQCSGLRLARDAK
ncbi:MAG: ergothioneine biosynthesis protein EgtB [Gammaproteobacteria bacterium]|nr:ergothioneine biosynthesis protein EgtB [Gammaproteobacteria bacterium]